METSGISQIAATQGAVRILPADSVTGLRLQADSVTIEMDWAKGYGANPEYPLFRYTMEKGSERVRLDDAIVQFEPFEGEPFFLPFSDDDAGMDLSIATNVGYSLTPDIDPKVVGIGQHPDSVSATDQDPLGFWYLPEGPLIRGDGRSNVQVEGSFSLFVHNVTIDASGSNRDWSDWTGDWAESPDRPVSEVEQRVTVIHVENGTFVSTTKDDVTLFAPALSTDFEGIVTANRVTGSLLQERRVHLFDEDPFRIEGVGSMILDAEDESEEQHGPHLVVNASGSFDVQGASKIEPLPDSEHTSWPWVGSSTAAGTGLLVLLVALGLLMVVGFIPVPMGVRQRLYDQWMKRGRRARDDDALDRAVRYFKNATRVKRDEPLAWYEWAHTELEAGNNDSADKIAVQAMEIPGIDLLDLLDLRACAALENKDLDAFNGFLAELAEKSPKMARRLVLEMAIEPEVLSPKLRETLKDESLDGDLKGYA